MSGDTLTTDHIRQARDLLAKNGNHIRPLMTPRWLALALGTTPAEWDAMPGGDWKPLYWFPVRRKP